MNEELLKQTLDGFAQDLVELKAKGRIGRRAIKEKHASELKGATDQLEQLTKSDRDRLRSEQKEVRDQANKRIKALRAEYRLHVKGATDQFDAATKAIRKQHRNELDAFDWQYKRDVHFIHRCDHDIRKTAGGMLTEEIRTGKEYVR